MIIQLDTLKLLKFLFVLLVFTFLAGCTKENASNGDNSASGKGGSLAKFTLSGNYLYVVDNSVLYTYDVSDSKNPVLQDQTYIDATSETIFPYKDKLFIGTTTGMFIYAIQQNGRPAYLGSASHVRSCDPVVSNDTVAYVTLSGNNRCGPGDYLSRKKKLVWQSDRTK